MKAFNRKTGAEIAGTLEKIPGTALIASFSRDKDGALKYEHAGETDVFWDGQETLTNAEGLTKFIDVDGDECVETDIYLEGERAADDEAETQSYRVTWVIDVEATNPVEAAQKARDCQIRPGTTAKVFEVDDDDGGHWDVDLDDPDATYALPRTDAEDHREECMNDENAAARGRADDGNALSTE